MSRGLDGDGNDRAEKPDRQRRITQSQGRAGGGEDDRADRPQGNDSARSEQHPLAHECERVRCGRHRYEWSETERTVIRVSRLRTLDEQDNERVFYRANPKQFQADLNHLSKQCLLLRRSVIVGENGEIRRVVVLSKHAKRLAVHRRLATEGQAVYAGFVKPADVSHDALIYKMFEAEATRIRATGGRVNRVVLDSELNKNGDYGDLSYARRQQDLAKLHRLPVVDGEISFPDLRLEYDTDCGERAHIDLELRTENYRPCHVSQKVRAGFKIYGVNSTSQGPSSRGERSRDQCGNTGLMSAPVMARHERSANVQRLGYAEPEAESLALVPLRGVTSYAVSSTLGSALERGGAKTGLRPVRYPLAPVFAAICRAAIL